MITDVKDLFAPWSLPALGAFETEFRVELSAGELKPIDFVAAGVPADSEIIAVNYLPMGGDCFPIETHGNMPGRRWVDKKTALVGAPLQAVAPGPSTILVRVYWVPAGDDSEPWLLMASALSAASRGEWAAVIPAAHGAFEISLSRVIRDVLELVTGKDVVKIFMQEALTAASAVNVILPLFCVWAEIPPPNIEIRGRLSRLRKLRNDLAHQGVGAVTLNEREVRELLVAAVFGFEFVRFARDAMVAAVRAKTASTASHRDTSAS